MKWKLIAFALCMFTAHIHYAQFSVQLSAGAGQSAANVRLDYNNYHMAHNGNTGSYYLYGGIGYQLRRWRLSTGVEFFRTGFNKGFAYSNDQFGFYENIRAHAENMAIPLLLSYRIPLAKKLSIVPAAGGAMIYTARTYAYTNDMTLNIDPWDHLGWGRELTAGAIAKISAELALGKKTAISAGPSLRYFKPNPSLQYFLYLFEVGLAHSF
jgi:hypothetical protein